jgi:DNA processing protein
VDAEGWIRLAATPGLDEEGLAWVLERFATGAELLRQPGRAGTPLAALGGGLEEARVEEALRWLDHDHRHLVHRQHPAWPQLLRDVADAPLALFTEGDPELLGYPLLAVVGSRHPTPAGVENATAFAGHLASRGIGICSGLASGVDAAAHRGALAAAGITVAVLGCGPDRVYPAENRDLFRSVAESGVIVSEYPPGTPPRREHFPRRNRLISGLSLGTLVVEAARRSGSLITARLAGEQGREIFAIPGSIHNPMARGCHRLIREGAVLVETADDILRELGPLAAAAAEGHGGDPLTTPETAPPGESGLDPEYAELLDAFGYEPVTADILARRTGLTAAEVSSMLLILELQGHVGSAPGGRYTRVNTGT